MITENRPCLTLEKNWVVVDRDKNVFKFITFQEAIDSKLEGTLMTEKFYKYNYQNNV